MTDSVIRIVAAVILDPAGRMLLVRKRGTTAFMQPGGKPEPGESSEAALVRELAEEVGFALDPLELEHIGRYTARAANEPGHTVDADVFFLVVTDEGEVAAEIEELLWVDPHELGDLDIAPLTSEVLLPFILTRSSALQRRSDP